LFREWRDWGTWWWTASPCRPWDGRGVRPHRPPDGLVPTVRLVLRAGCVVGHADGRHRPGQRGESPTHKLYRVVRDHFRADDWRELEDMVSRMTATKPRRLKAFDFISHRDRSATLRNGPFRRIWAQHDLSSYLPLHSRIARIWTEASPKRPLPFKPPLWLDRHLEVCQPLRVAHGLQARVHPVAF
jgi:hypothetical protein